MPNLFGTPTGAMLADDERRVQQLHEVNLEKGEIELEQARMALESQKRMSQMMSGEESKSGPGSPSVTYNMADRMDALANIAMKSGLPEKAKEYANTASTLRKNTAEVTKTKLETDIKEMTLMGQLLTDVDDERSWQRANAVYQIQTGKQSPWARLQFNEQLVSQLQTGIQTARDRAAISLSKAREKASEASASESRARIELIGAQKDLAEERARSLRKAGATSSMPKASSIKAITDLMFKDYAGSMLPEEARVIARPIAESMDKLIKQGNIPASEAAMRAYQEAKARGDFTGYQPFEGSPGTFKAPLKLPKDRNRLEKNLYYNTPQGVMLFNGKNFENPPEGVQEEGEEEEE